MQPGRLPGILLAVTGRHRATDLSGCRNRQSPACRLFAPTAVQGFPRPAPGPTGSNLEIHPNRDQAQPRVRRRKGPGVGTLRTERPAICFGCAADMQRKTAHVPRLPASKPVSRHPAHPPYRLQRAMRTSAPKAQNIPWRWAGVRDNMNDCRQKLARSWQKSEYRTPKGCQTPVTRP